MPLATGKPSTLTSRTNAQSSKNEHRFFIKINLSYNLVFKSGKMWKSTGGAQRVARRLLDILLSRQKQTLLVMELEWADFGANSAHGTHRPSSSCLSLSVSLSLGQHRVKWMSEWSKLCLSSNEVLFILIICNSNTYFKDDALGMDWNNGNRNWQTLSQLLFLLVHTSFKHVILGSVAMKWGWKHLISFRTLPILSPLTNFNRSYVKRFTSGVSRISIGGGCIPGCFGGKLVCSYIAISFLFFKFLYQVPKFWKL